MSKLQGKVDKSPEVPPETNKLVAGLNLGERFELVQKLGEGGIGEVWLAKDGHLDDELVALKILRSDLSRARAALTDLKHELLLTRKLRHPNIIDVHTFWRAGGFQFITMEYVKGETLGAALSGRDRPFTVREVLSWFQQLSSALDYAHSQGVLHRDIKPENVLLDEDGQIRIADFGLGSTLWECEGEEDGSPTIPQGTLMYISPEQLAGDSLDGKSDQYSLASTIYELISGAPPFHSGEIAAQIQVKSAPAIEYLSKTLNKSLLRALSKSSLKRFGTCMEFYTAFALAVGKSEEQGLGTATRVLDDQNRDTVVLNKASFNTRKTRLGRLLVDAGVITQMELMDALIYQNKEEMKLGQSLVTLGSVSWDEIIETLSEQLQIPKTTLRDEDIDTSISQTITKVMAIQYQCVPLRKTTYGVLVAITDPLNMEALNFLEEVYWNDIELRVATEDDIEVAIKQVYGE